MRSRRDRTMTVRVALALTAVVSLTAGARETAAGQTADVSGNWMLTVESANGTTTPSVMLEQNGSELTGHYSSETLGEADVTGTVNGNTVEFSFAAEVQGFALDVTYTGTLSDDGTLAGEASFGEAGDGTFTGKKG